MKPTLVLIALALGAVLLVSGCTGGPSPAATPAATKAPATPGVSADDAKALEALLNTSVPDLPSLPDLSL